MSVFRLLLTVKYPDFHQKKKKLKVSPIHTQTIETASEKAHMVDSVDKDLKEVPENSNNKIVFY